MNNEPKLENLFNIRDKVVVLVGATGLLGSQYSEFLSSLGAKVVIADVSIERCNEMADKVRTAYNADCLPVQMDITDEESINGLFGTVINHYGKIDVLINNAQIKPDGFYASFENYRKDTLMKVLDGNLGGVVLCSQKAAIQFLKQGYGNIINVASTYGLVGADQRIYDGVKNIYFPDERFSSPVSYAITKAGIVNLTRWLASYYREKNIRVNCLTPGGVGETHDGVFFNNYSYRTLLGRMAKPNEYNAAILYLASDASSYMTGSNLVVDGGWTAV